MTRPESLFTDPAAVNAGNVLLAGYLDLARFSASEPLRSRESEVATQVAYMRYPHFAASSAEELTGTILTPETDAYVALLQEAVRLHRESETFVKAKAEAAQSLGALISEKYISKQVELRPRFKNMDSAQLSTAHRIAIMRNTRGGIIHRRSVDTVMDGTLQIALEKWQRGQLRNYVPSSVTIVGPDLQLQYDLAVQL
jgi:hypothetical protein